MRRKVRLTGRRQLKPSYVGVHILPMETGGLVATMDIKEAKRFDAMPGTARIKLRLFENNFSETLEFGDIDSMLAGKHQSMNVANEAFAAPSCQLRIVDSGKERKEDKGKILGSTNKWTVHVGGDEESGTERKGILPFLPGKIAPLVWHLELREYEHPILYVDKSVPKEWAKTDPVFAGCVFPEVIRKVFNDILSRNDPAETWEREWLKWADLLTGEEPPWRQGGKEKEEWIDRLIRRFLENRDFLGKLVKHLKSEQPYG